MSGRTKLSIFFLLVLNMNFTAITDDPDSSLNYFMTAEGQTNTGMLVAGVAAAIVSIVYACRHLKTSTCCGFSCEQAVVDAPITISHDGRMESHV